MKKISVIIPTFNEEKSIRACLISLSKQSVKRDMEIIVVDDGSTDKTVVEIHKTRSDYFGNDFIIAEQKHGGAGKARNLGVKKSKGELLVFLDADMTFEPDFIEKLIIPIYKQDIPGTFSKEEFVSNWENVWARCWNYNENLPNNRRLPKDYPNSQKVFRAIKREVFNKAGGFSGVSYTDDYTIAEKLGIEAINAPFAKYYHANPASLREVFKQSKWVAKRKYKMGMVGNIITLARLSLPFAKFIGVYKAIKYKTWQFFVFKLVYNTGASLGVIDFMVRKRGFK